MKKILTIFSIVALLSSCYKENEIIPDVLVSKGKIANIAVIWAGPTRPTTTLTVDAGTVVPVTLEFFSDEPIKEFKLYSRPATTGTYVLFSTVAVSMASVVYDAKLRNSVVKFNVTAPAAKNATLQVAAEIITTNELPSGQRTVTIRTKA